MMENERKIMNKHLRHVIEIAQAALDGKTIQTRIIGDGSGGAWCDVDLNCYYLWDFTKHEFRVKPAARFRITYIRGTDGKFHGPAEIESDRKVAVIEFTEV